MAKPLIIDPAFAVPLTAQELHDLGVIAVVWGQIDFQLDQILAHALAFDPDQQASFIAEKPMQAKLDMLKADYARLPKRFHKQAAELLKRLSALKQSRNSAFHGVWGWRLEKRSQTLQVAAYHPKTKDNPLRPIQLRGMAEELIDCSKLAGSILAQLQGLEFRTAARFTWGGAGPDGQPPAWPLAPHGQWYRGRSPTERRRRPRPPTPPKDAAR